MAPWKLPLIVAALALPLIGGFLLAGPALGTALGAIAITTLIVIAVRQRPRGPIGPPPGEELHRVLIVITAPVEEPAAVEEMVRVAGLSSRPEGVDVLLLAPAQISFLDRWATDVEGARRAAQASLVATVAALAKAGIAAEARVGDESVVQAVEDQLESFAADEVVLVSAGEENGAVDHDVAELGARLRADFRHVELGA